MATGPLTDEVKEREELVGSLDEMVEAQRRANDSGCPLQSRCVVTRAGHGSSTSKTRRLLARNDRQGKGVKNFIVETLWCLVAFCAVHTMNQSRLPDRCPWDNPGRRDRYEGPIASRAKLEREKAL